MVFIDIYEKTMLFFGTIGFFMLLAGVIAGVIAIVMRLEGTGYRPLLYLT